VLISLVTSLVEVAKNPPRESTSDTKWYILWVIFPGKPAVSGDDVVMIIVVVVVQEESVKYEDQLPVKFKRESFL